MQESLLDLSIFCTGFFCVKLERIAGIGDCDMNNERKLLIALCAGEASGDLLGAHLISAIKKLYPNCEFIGIGGKKMISVGCNSLYPQEKLSVRGFAEVVNRLPEILSIRKGLIKKLLQRRPDVFVGIDLPDFNFGVEKQLKQAGIATVHYVSPSVWAWRSRRVEKIVQIADKVLCLFPMEAELYRNAGGDAQFVGHPLAQTIEEDNDRAYARRALTLPQDIPVFTLMPGSRISELEYLVEDFLRGAAHVWKKYSSSQFLIPSATDETNTYLRNLLQRDEYRRLPVRLLYGRAQTAIVASDAVLVASGTASLETALCRRPMVVAYRVSPITFAIAKNLVKLPYVGLPNILLQKFAVPELLQGEVNAEKISEMLCYWYESPEHVARLQQDFAMLHQTLKQDTDVLAAKAVLDVIDKHSRKKQTI